MILKFILGTSAHKYKKYINVIVVEIQVLKQHTETNHKGLKKYKCDTCEKYFTALHNEHFWIENRKFNFPK